MYGAPVQLGKPLTESSVNAQPWKPTPPKLSAPEFNPNKPKVWTPHNPEDTFMSFVGQEFLYHNFALGTWALGESTTLDGTSFSVPENGAIVRIDPSLECSHSKAFVLGGVDNSGNVLDWAMGIDF